MLKVFKYTLIDLARNRFVLGYALLMLFVAEGLFFVEDDPSKALLSLVQVVMALVPLIALVFTIVYSYDSLEFTQLLAVHPTVQNHAIQSIPQPPSDAIQKNHLADSSFFPKIQFR